MAAKYPEEETDQIIFDSESDSSLELFVECFDHVDHQETNTSGSSMFGDGIIQPYRFEPSIDDEASSDSSDQQNNEYNLDSVGRLQNTEW